MGYPAKVPASHHAVIDKLHPGPDFSVPARVVQRVSDAARLARLEQELLETTIERALNQGSGPAYQHALQITALRAQITG